MLNHSLNKDYIQVTLEKIFQQWVPSKTSTQRFRDLEAEKLKLQSTSVTDFRDTIEKGLQELLRELQQEQELR